MAQGADSRLRTAPDTAIARAVRSAALGFLNPRDFYEDGVFRLMPGPIFSVLPREKGAFEPRCAYSHPVVDSFLHSVWAFWEGGSDEGFSAQAEAYFEGFAVDFCFGAEGLAGIA